MYHNTNHKNIKAYISYSLPFETHKKTFVGDVVSYKSINNVNLKTGFIINSFNNSKNYLIENLECIDLIDFKLFYSQNSHFCISKNDYIVDCNKLISTLKNSDIDKVVLSRVKKVGNTKSPIEIFNQLNNAYKNTFNYLISIENVGCWMGATPESLVNIEKDLIKTVSIAGTKTIDVKKWGKKELEEQQMVTSFISKQLKPYLLKFDQDELKTITAGTVQHLKTEFSGYLKQKKDWVSIVKDLHPTPATCGLPKHEAQSSIQLIENHDRKFYTGFLGPISGESKQLFVNLRCMEIQKNSAYLFLGGGITSQSKAEDEWVETKNKAKTLLSITNQDSN